MNQLPHHQKLIEDSAISTEVAQARGYRSAAKRSELERLGFARTQQNVPALLIPIWGVSGEVVNYQSRPDTPRIRDGKPVKYETPASSRMAIDVHPHARPWLTDVSRPLFITEGIRKADAAVSQGLCCVALLGVWNWRGKHDGDGVAALADWEHIALKGRDACIVFDSDVTQKKQVRAALRRLRAFLELRGALVKIAYLPCRDGGVKVGLDDFFAEGRTVDELLAHSTTELRGDESGDEFCPYSETEQGLVWHRETAQGSATILLTNFAARVVGDVSEDDGAEIRRVFEVEARLAGRQNNLPTRGTITALEFGAMRWPINLLGPQAIIYPHKTEHARCAVQALSADVQERHVYTHTGWRKIGGEWAYLHGGGAINASGSFNAHVRLPDSLNCFELPSPPEGCAFAGCVRESLRLLSVAPLQITVPLLGAAWAGVLGGTDFTISLVGQSGTGKTALASLIQAFFGARFEPNTLPASWSSTGNALEGLAHVLKDAVLVVDDFAPTGTPQDVARMHREADRILRAQGNRSARGRMRPDGSLRPNKPPRGLIISTGEGIPKGQSLGARQLVVEVTRESLNWALLTEYQKAARTNVYASALSGYVRLIAGSYEDIQQRAALEIGFIRDLIARSLTGHKRTPTIVAELMRGWLLFLKAVVLSGALDEGEARSFVEIVWSVLGEVAARQSTLQEVQDPAQRFVEILSSAVASGRAHFAGTDGKCPREPQAFGWREDGLTWKAQGTRVGWSDGVNIYIEPDAAYTLTSGMAEGLPVTQQTLWKRLREKGLLASVDEKRETLKIRRKIEGRSIQVLHIRTSLLLEGLSAFTNSDKPDNGEGTNNCFDVAEALWESVSDVEPPSVVEAAAVNVEVESA